MLDHHAQVGLSHPGSSVFPSATTVAGSATAARTRFRRQARILRSRHGLLSTAAWRRRGRTCYAVEGSTFVAGAAVQWLRDGLGLIRSSAEVEALARRVNDTGGVMFVPAFAGLFAPYWRSDARGVIAGLTGFVTKEGLDKRARNADVVGVCLDEEPLPEPPRVFAGNDLPPAKPGEPCVMAARVWTTSAWAWHAKSLRP